MKHENPNRYAIATHERIGESLGALLSRVDYLLIEALRNGQDIEELVNDRAVFKKYKEKTRKNVERLTFGLDVQ